MTTLSFVAPEVVIPQIVQQLRRDIDAQEVEGLTETDLAIWATPEGTTYIDGLLYYRRFSRPPRPHTRLFPIFTAAHVRIDLSDPLVDIGGGAFAE